MRPNRPSPLKLSLLSCAIASAVAGFSPSALAVDLCAGESAVTVSSANPGDSCNLNQANATLTVTSAGSIGLGVDVNADGVTITNNGDIGASQTALHYLGSHAISTLTNNGNILVDGSTQAFGLLSNGTVDLDGTLLNTGLIEVSASTSSSGAEAYGILIADDVAGQLINRGHITVSATGSQALAHGISVDHEVSGDILNIGSIIATGEGSNDGHVYGIDTTGVTDAGRIRNTGTISALVEGQTVVGAYGIDAGVLSGTAAISNIGTVAASANSSSSEADAYGIRTDTLGDESSIRNSGHIQAEAGGSSVEAHGIKVQNLNDSAVLENSGRIDATAMGSVSGYAYGIYASGLFGNASLSNSGTIHALASGGTASNSAFGIRVGTIAGSTASLLNTGTISATAMSGSNSAGAFGIYADTLSAGTLRNDGTVTVSVSGDDPAALYALGMSAHSLTGSGVMTNDGIVRASATGAGSGSSNVSAWGMRALYTSGSSEFSNSGRVVATATGNGQVTAYAMHAYQTLEGSARLSNSGSLVARAVSNGNNANAYGMQAEAMAGTAALTNTDDIDVSVISDNGYGYALGIGVDNGLSDTSRIDNRGTVSVNVSGATAAASGLWVEATTADGAAIVNTGNVTVVADAGSGGAYAYGWGARTLLGTLANDGELDVRATGPSDATADGMWLATGNGGVVRNTGSISAIASGSASVIAHGIYTEGNTLGTTVSNSDSILALATAGDGSSSAASAFGIYAHTVDATSSISNSGDIVVAAAADNAQAYGIYVRDALDGTVTNTGTIVADASGPSSSAYGVYAGGGSGSVSNSGTIIGGVSLNGTVDLDNSGHILTTAGNPSNVGGDYTQGTDGLLTLQVESAGRYAALDVGGEADFTASDRLNIIVTPDVTLVDGSTLANVVSAGTLTTDLDGLTVTDSSLFWVFTGVMDGDTLDLDVDFGGAAAGLAGSGQAFTASQLAFADAVLLAGSGGTYSALSAALNGAADAHAAADALESVGPALPGAAAAALRSAGAGASHAISARQGETRGAASGDAFSQNALWLKPFVGQAEQDSVDGVDGYDVDSNGFVIGLDGDVSDGWRLGVAVASGQGEVGGAKASLDVTSTQLTVYGSYAMSDSATLDLNIDYLSSSVDSTRLVALANTSARASYDASQFAAGATVSNRVAMSERSVFIPSLQARYQRVSLDGYTETGAGVYDLTVESGSEGSLLWAAEGAFEIGMGKGTLLASAGLGYDTLDAASLTATLNGGTGPTFISNGIKPESTVVTGGLGYRHVTAKALEINVAYDMESRGDFVAQTVSLKFKLPL